MGGRQLDNTRFGMESYWKISSSIYKSSNLLRPFSL